MKTNIFIALLGFMTILLLEGCTEGFLEEENIRAPVADQHFTSSKGFNDLVNSSYQFLRSYYGKEEGHMMTTLGTDIWGAGYGSVQSFNNYDGGMAPGHGFYWNVWSGFYQGIATCNTIIGRASEVEDISEADLNIRLGEAYFLRAMYYHILVMHWGAVPLELEEVREVKTTATRTPENEVYEQIITDLLMAEQLLPPTQPDYGRATKPAAQALLARVYLTTNQNEEAATYAKTVINDYNFSLLDDFAEIWDIDNEQNSEVIWAVQYTRDERLNSGGNRSHLYFLMEYDFEPGLTLNINYGRSWVRYFPSRFFLNMLQETRWKDSRYEKVWKEVWYANNPNNLLPEQQLGDTALVVVPYSVPQEVEDAKADKYTIFDIDRIYDGENPIGKKSRWPTLFEKHTDPLRSSNINIEGSRDWFVFRLAEMYLIAAEALMKQDKASEGVIYMNTLRERAAWPGNEADMEITADQLTIDFILDERALELAGEMFRWPDLKRTGKLIERVKLYNPEARANIQETHLVRPIPTNMIDRITNKEEFTQNPGY
ncbi:MAG: RagB/SusD family nutrient uptake outer membrane protein [Anditalea sp.]